MRQSTRYSLTPLAQSGRRYAVDGQRAMIALERETTLSDPIICPLWEPKDKRFLSRRYHAWDRRCGLCGRTVVVSEAVKQLLDSSPGIALICEHRALLRAPESEPEAFHEPDSNAIEDVNPCPTCAILKEQQEEAAKQLARCDGLPDSHATETARRKWAHSLRARSAHQFKAHTSDRRGRV